MSEDAIRETIAAWSAATDQPGEAGADGYASFATDDVINVAPNREHMVGREALREFALEFTGADEWTIRFSPEHIEVAASGDLAYAIGSYTFRLRDPEGTLIEDTGSFLDAFKKQADGTWKVSAIAYSSDLPT